MLTPFWIDLTEPSAKQKLALLPPTCWLPKALRSWTLIPSIGTEVFMGLSSGAKESPQAHPPSACDEVVAGRFLRERSPNISVWLVPSETSVTRTAEFM